CLSFRMRRRTGSYRGGLYVCLRSGTGAQASEEGLALTLGTSIFVGASRRARPRSGRLLHGRFAIAREPCGLYGPRKAASPPRAPAQAGRRRTDAACAARRISEMHWVLDRFFGRKLEEDT